MSNNLVFELGVEEIPPSESPRLATQLKEHIESLLGEERLEHDEISSQYTPRRLVVHVLNLVEAQEDITVEARGPAKKVAYDEDGNLTKAALGFSKGNGVEPEDLYLKEIPEGEYIYATKHVKGRKTTEILADLLPKTISTLSPSETMRWDETGTKFIRPIRWILALYGDTHIELRYGDLKSGQTTRGHRFLGEPEVNVSQYQDFESSLGKNGVLLDPTARRAKVLEALEKISGEIKASPALSDALLNEIADNLEHPAPVLGQFPEDFLELPREILETTIVEHQKFVPFVVEDKPSQYFVGFRDGSDGSDQLVREGYERVVKARLRDSVFFFEEDRRTSLAERTQILKRVVYQEKLGSIWDKTDRMRKIAAAIGKRIGSNYLDDIDRTLFLCKADLLTTMVGEFPELEGIVGGLYAQLEGESELVSQGIYEHYLPKGAGDSLPESHTGIIASLSDKLDTVAGSLLIGEQVSGSRDPFGLRRKANGIIRIALASELDIDFFEILVSLQEHYAFPDSEVDLKRVFEFFMERLQGELKDEHAIPYDVVDAVTAQTSGNFVQVLRKAKAIEAIRGEEKFQSLVTAFERACNILKKQASQLEFDPQLFSEDAERELWRTMLKASAQIEELLPGNQYSEIIEQLIELREPIDQYFESVMVMDQDSRIRDNRLAFLSNLAQLFYTIGDLSKIVVEGE